MDNNNTQSGSRPDRPVIFGEVLFDCFEGGHDVLGGAPFNVAWHLQGFGQQPLFISRIGQDDLGDEVLLRMEAWGMDTQGVQRDPDHPTGRVNIVQQGASHAFDILPDQAYDHIDADTACKALLNTDVALVYFGTLARRMPDSRDAMDQVQQLGYPVFVDVNLRAPWWERVDVEGLMRKARWFKLNDEEIDLLQQAPPGTEADAARTLLEQYGLEMLVFTRGADGATLLTRDCQVEGRPPPVRQMVDTVGAGDAFCAVVILGLLNGWPLEQTLQRALAFGSRISGQRGATAPDKALYQQYRESWGL